MTMLEQALNYLNNWFPYEPETYRGRCSITDGVLACGLALRDGAYYHILGSRFHDGLYQYLVPAEDLEEDDFEDVENDGELALTEDEEDGAEPEEGLTDTGVDEVFFGSVSLCALPASFLALVNDMEAWQAKYGDAISSPFQSESFGGYSYSKSSGAATESGTATVWTQFAEALAPYKRPPMARGGRVRGQAHQAPAYVRPFNPDFRGV